MRGARGPRLVAVGIATAASLALWTTSATAGTWPGQNGDLFFSGTGSISIYRFDPDTGSLTFVKGGDTASYTNVDLAPHGETMTFQSNFDSDSDVNRASVDGSGQITIISGSDFQGEPSYLKLTCGGTCARGTTPVPPPTPQVAFTFFDGNDFEIGKANLDGSGQIPLTDNTVNDFSPAGGNGIIAFVRDLGPNNAVFTMGPNGENQTQITPDSLSASTPSFSPDFATIFFAGFGPGATNFDLHRINVDGSGHTQLTDTPEHELDPALSPDRQRLAYTLSPPGFGSAQIALSDPNGQNPVQVTSGPQNFFTPDWQALNPPGFAQFDVKATAKRIDVTLTLDEDATVTVSGDGKAPRAAGLATASKAKKFKLKPTTSEVQPSAATTLKLKIPKKGKKALEQTAEAGKKGKVTVTATATDDLGQSSTETEKAKVKKKK